MNGMYRGFFKSQHGLQQGNPLSPYLFILMEEILSRLLERNFEEGMIGNFYHLGGTLLVSYLLYTDDLLVFANREMRSLKMLLKTLDLYESCSGQLINKEKSVIFLSNKINNSRRMRLF